MNASHASLNDNRRIYYDFMNHEFLPIYYDGMARLFPFQSDEIMLNENIKKGAINNLQTLKTLNKNYLVNELFELGLDKSNKSCINKILLKKINRLIGNAFSEKLKIK